MKFPKVFFLSLILGILFSILVATLQSARNQEKLQQAAATLSTQLASQIQSKLERYQYGLRGARGVILTVGPDKMRRDIFHRYAESRDQQLEFPGARGFGFIRKVKPEEMDDFLQAARADSTPDFNVRQLQAHAGTSYVIQYIEPLASNKVALGLDIASETLRREAADAATRSGVAQLTAPITLVQTNGVNQAFLFLLPVYATAKTPDSVEDREKQLLGWTYAPLFMPDVLASLRLHQQDVNLRLSDITLAGSKTQIYDTQSQIEESSGQAPQTQEIIIYGRRWLLELSLQPEFVAHQNLLLPEWIFFISAIISVLLATLLQILQHNREQKNALIKDQSELAAIVSSASDAIIGKTLQGVITSWNNGATQLFGYPPGEAIGKRLVDLIVPPELADQEEMILTAIGRGEEVRHFQTQRRRKDGSLVEVSVNVSPIFDDNNRVISASKTVRDITTEKLAEQRMQEINSELEGLVKERTEALERARNTLQTILDAVPSVIGYSDSKLINRVSNKAFGDWFGLNPAQVPGTHVRDLIGETAFVASLPYIEAALSGEPQLFERSMQLPGRTNLLHALVNYLPDVGPDHQVRGFYVFMHDVTEITNKRLQLDAALRENEALLFTINQKMLSSVTAADGTLLSVNHNFCTVSGYDEQELVGKNHVMLSSGLHPASYWKSIWDVLVTGQSWQGIICNRTKDGGLFWLDAVVSPFMDDNGKVARFVGLYLDITHKKAAEEEIRRLNVLFSNVLKAASEVAIIATDMEGQITIFNTGAERMLGYRADELVGKSSPAVFHVMDEIITRGQELSAEYGEQIEGFRVFVHKPEQEGAEIHEWTYVRKDQSHLRVSLAATPIRDDDGRIEGYLGVAIDVSQQYEQQKKLAFASGQLEKAAKIADLGIWVWDLADNALEWNDRMYEIYQQPLVYREQGLKYEHWRDRVNPEDVLATEANLMAAVEGRGVYDIVFRVELPDGRTQYIQAGGLVERDERGNATRVTGINRDITSQRELETQLRLAKQHADDASASKSRFLANMSHEIRTPMNAVLGMLQLVQQTALNPRQQDYLIKAQTAAKSLLGLLNDILDFSKIDAGKLELDPHPFEFEDLMRDLAVILSGNMSDKNVEVIFDLALDLPRTVVGDRLRMQQVLINLAGNALKFTHEGNVVVSVKAIAQNAHEVDVRVAVSDTGIGISSEQLSRIFDGFVQAEASTTRRFGGTGLGLVISKRLIALMGGELQVESTPGKGSCFSFDVRLPVSDARPVINSADFEKLNLRVLVVDDNPLMTEILSNTVAAMGWNVELAHGGMEAVDKVAIANTKGQPYELILMDWRMHDLDGVGAARQIRDMTPADTTPIIIMVSAFGREILAETSNEGQLPFNDLLGKPVTQQQLLRAVRRAMSGEPLLAAPGQTMHAGSRQLAGLRILVVEDNALNRQVAFELLTNEGAMVELAEGGCEGVAKVTSREYDYDIVLMDVQMPDIDGREATRRIRADGRFDKLPILAATADAGPADRDECLAAGMNAHIGKPIDLHEMITSILKLLGRTSQPTMQLAKPAPDAASSPDIEGLPEVLKRFANMFPMYLSIFELFEPEAHRLLNVLSTAIMQADKAQAKVALHSLKGVSATVGACKLANRAAVLEKALRDNADQDGGLPDVGTVNELQNLLDSSLSQLTAANQAYKLAITAPKEADVHSSTLDPAQTTQVTSGSDDIKLKLTELLPLVQSNNLLALDMMEALYAGASAQDQQRLSTLTKQIQALDFQAALQAIDALLE